MDGDTDENNSHPTPPSPSSSSSYYYYYYYILQRSDIDFISRTLGCLPVAHIDSFTSDKLGSAELVTEVTVPGASDKVRERIEGGGGRRRRKEEEEEEEEEEEKDRED